MWRVLGTGIIILAVLSTSIAQAVTPSRDFNRELDETFVDPLGTALCGVPILEHDTGTVMTTIFYGQDGKPRAINLHQVSAQSVYTNTVTGATLTVYLSNFVRQSVSSTTSATSTTLKSIFRFVGVNYRIKTPNGTSVAAGNVTEIVKYTFDQNGNLIDVSFRLKETPNQTHISEVLVSELCPR